MKISYEFQHRSPVKLFFVEIFIHLILIRRFDSTNKSISFISSNESFSSSIVVNRKNNVAKLEVKKKNNKTIEKKRNENFHFVFRSSGEFRFCATCGRSTGVRLTLCKRCQKTAFCSKTCKINGWNEFHRYECHSTSSNHLCSF